VISHRRLGYALAGLGICSVFVDTVLADPAKMLRVKPATATREFTNGYSKSMYGIGCTPVVNGTKTCGNVNITDTSNIGNPNSIPIDPPYQVFLAGVGEYIYEAGQDFYSSYRYISCPIVRSALTGFSISDNGANLTVTIDTSSPDCSGFGQLRDPTTDTYSLWDFGGAPIVVQARMTSARFPARLLTAGSITDTQLRATHRYACDQSIYNQAAGIISFGGRSFVMFNTGGQDNFDNFGQYSYVRCRDAGRTN